MYVHLHAEIAIQLKIENNCLQSLDWNSGLDWWNGVLDSSYNSILALYPSILGLVCVTTQYI